MSFSQLPAIKHPFRKGELILLIEFYASAFGAPNDMISDVAIRSRI